MANNALVVTLCSFAMLIAAYFVYGRFLARRVFLLDPKRATPAHTMHDGVDYMPTRIPVLFGHHFASIAGLGPILGPALAVIWGWLPAVIWVVFGSIFIGAVHDLGSMNVSLRYKGRSIGDVGRELIGPRSRLLFLLIIFFAMSLAMGAFVNTITALFLGFNPDAIIPSFGLMIVAVCVGLAVYRLKVSLGLATVIGLVAFAGLIVLGQIVPVPSYDWFVSDSARTALQTERQAKKLEKPYGAVDAMVYFTNAAEKAKLAGDVDAEKTSRSVVTEIKSAIGSADHLGSAQTTWIVVLLGYGFLASVLPVWLLLQPRDYINSFQLYAALGLLLLGLFVAGFTGSEFSVIHAQAIRTPNIDFEMPDNVYRPLLPFLFVTIACGAVSGFHSLVSSGTTVRQLNKETDALPIGYGAMLTEGALAVLVIMACVAGLGAQAWQPDGPYGSWSRLGGVAPQLNAVVQGGANFLGIVGVPLGLARTFLAVTIVAFALTTLDSATRLLRFNVEEILHSVKLEAFANRYVASLIAVAGIAFFSFVPAMISGGRVLWTLFGTANQLLAGLALLTVSLFLYRMHRPIWFTVIPMVLMLGVTIWAMILGLIDFANSENWTMVAVTGVILLMSLWLVVEAAVAFARGRDTPLSDMGTDEGLEKIDEIAPTTHLG